MSETHNLLEDLNCPVCHAGLGIDNNMITCLNNHHFEQNNKDWMNLTYPTTLSGSDATFFEQYKEIAQIYDQASKDLFAMHASDEEETRSSIVAQLGFQNGDKVLEISTGTGLNIPYILFAIGEEGELVVQDLSPHMLRVARQKFEEQGNLKFIQSNASYLPFEDNFFDAVVHFGGINTFTEKERAIREIQRVTRPGGSILLSDEGMGPWNLGTEYGTTLLQINGLYKEQPPLELLPVEVEDVKLYWIMGNVFYVLQWRKRKTVPELLSHT